MTSIGFESTIARPRRSRVPYVAASEDRPVPTEGGRRLLNVLVAAVGLLAAAPLMALIAVIIRLTSHGPILYAQTRVGLDRRTGRRQIDISRRRRDMGGRPFRIYKFRTMYVDRSDVPAEAWARPDDPRITPVGRVLRKYRLDELPQLWNVLRGDMNVVGPRPEQPGIFLELRGQIEGYGTRQLVRPGITGHAQTLQSYDSCLEDVRRKVELDLEYIGRCSVSEDLRIMMRTVPVMLFRKGAW